MANDLVLNPGALGGRLATDEIAGRHFQRIKMTFGPEDIADDVTKVTPFPVDPQYITTATTSLDSSTDLAAAASTDLDSAQISVGTTGQLIALVITSSVPLKAILKTVLNNAESSDLGVFFTQPANNEIIEMPSKLFYTQAHDGGAGLDGFRVTVTNLDGSQASDVYCTFFYDEV